MHAYADYFNGLLLTIQFTKVDPGTTVTQYCSMFVLSSMVGPSYAKVALSTKSTSMNCLQLTLQTRPSSVGSLLVHFHVINHRYIIIVIIIVINTFRPSFGLILGRALQNKQREPLQMG